MSFSSLASAVRITVVNDDPDFLQLIQGLWAAPPYHTSVLYGKRLTSIEPIRHTNADLLIVDLRVQRGRIAGLDVLRMVRTDPHLQAIPLLICTGDPYMLSELVAELRCHRAVETLVVPFEAHELNEAIELLLAP